MVSLTLLMSGNCFKVLLSYLFRTVDIFLCDLHDAPLAERNERFMNSFIHVIHIESVKRMMIWLVIDVNLINSFIHVSHIYILNQYKCVNVQKSMSEKETQTSSS